MHTYPNFAVRKLRCQNLILQRREGWLYNTFALTSVLETIYNITWNQGTTTNSVYQAISAMPALVGDLPMLAKFPVLLLEKLMPCCVITSSTEGPSVHLNVATITVSVCSVKKKKIIIIIPVKPCTGDLFHIEHNRERRSPLLAASCPRPWFPLLLQQRSLCEPSPDQFRANQLD